MKPVLSGVERRLRPVSRRGRDIKRELVVRVHGHGKRQPVTPTRLMISTARQQQSRLICRGESWFRNRHTENYALSINRHRGRGPTIELLKRHPKLAG